MAYGRYRKKPYAARRPRKYTSTRKRSGMSKPTYRTIRKIAKSVINQDLETKRHTQTYSNINFAGNGGITGQDGHQLINVAIPSVGTAQNQRIGNKINIRGLVFNFNIQTGLAGNTNYPLTGKVYLIQHKEGGTSFPIGNFLDNDPNRSSITYNSLRNPDFYKDFVVLRTMTLKTDQDTYTGNHFCRSYSMKWKGNCPVSINSNVPTENSLFLLFVADIGYTNSTGGNAVNCFSLNGQSMMYYKDA